MGPFCTHCIDCDSAYAIFIEAAKRSGQGSSWKDRSLPYTASMTKEKQCQRKLSGELLRPSPPAEKAAARQDQALAPSGPPCGGSGPALTKNVGTSRARPPTAKFLLSNF